MFVGVWFTAVEGAGKEYTQDRQFILDSIRRHDDGIAQLQGHREAYLADRRFLFDALDRHQEAVNRLQQDRFDTAIRLAEIRIELMEIKRVLDRLEQGRRLE